MNPETLFEGVREANYHRAGIRCLQLFRIEKACFGKIQDDVYRLCRTERGSQVGHTNHVTSWTRPSGDVVQFSLLNASGCYDDFRDDHDLSCFGKRFRAASIYPALAQLIDLFPHTVNFRINLLGPSARLSPHEEHTVIRTLSGSVGLRTRFHLPVFTNQNAEMMLDGDIYKLEAGTVYFTNHGCVHSARNDGNQNRIHLVWDMLLTQEAFELMFATVLPPYPLTRITEIEWFPITVRSERIQSYERIAPLVSEDEAMRIGWCEVQ